MIHYILFVLLVLLQVNKSFAEACPPSNPSGLNENTLCIKHYIDVIETKYIDYGSGRISHFGEADNALRPGVGTIFRDTPLPSNEFYTRVTVGDSIQGVKVETNKGRIFQNLNDTSEQ